MKENIRHLKGMIPLFILIFILTAFCVVLPLYAADEKLPSGIGYNEIEEEVRNYFTEHQETSAGMAYSVFDGSRDIATGYFGYSDKEKGLPVDDDTVFEWGSGSKMLVWVSVMQLYEQGKLDLKEDIRTYLPEGFLTNQKYDTPITMIDLMNHQGGFQDQPVDMSITEDGYLTTLEEAVSAHKPDQIYEPGKVSAYSNWTTSLAAYIVGRISDMEFTDYVHKNIFDPLGMTHSAISSNLHDNDWVKEHRKKLQCYSDTGQLNPNAFYYCTLYPAGGCDSDFKDYLTFAKALLSRSDKLLTAKTWDEFYSPTDYFENAEMAKNCHGLWNVYFAVPTIGHIGKTSGCSSYILLDLKDQIGVAVICNQGNESTFSEKMMSLFFGDYKTSEYYQAEPVPSGNFYNTKTVEKGPFKITGLMGRLDKDMSEEYWTIADDYSPELMEIAYMDHLQKPAGREFLDLLLLYGFGAVLVIMVLMLVIRFLLKFIKVVKKEDKHKYPLRLWSIVMSILPCLVLLLFMMMMMSTAKPAYTFTWMSMAIGLITILQILMAGYGIFKNRKAEIPVKSKIYNRAIIILTVFTVIDICYWNLFMFWKI